MKNKGKASPCDICPYHLGIIQTLIFPCLQCWAGGFKLPNRLLDRTNSNKKRKLFLDQTKNTAGGMTPLAVILSVLLTKEKSGLRQHQSSPGSSELSISMISSRWILCPPTRIRTRSTGSMRFN